MAWGILVPDIQLVTWVRAGYMPVMAAARVGADGASLLLSVVSVLRAGCSRFRWNCPTAVVKCWTSHIRAVIRK